MSEISFPQYCILLLLLITGSESKVVLEIVLFQPLLSYFKSYRLLAA